MGCLKKGAIILGIIVAALVVFLGVGIALNVIGHSVGHSQGYKVGKVEGYDTGYQEGYDVGHVEGQDKGYQEGYDAGHAQGYDTGYAEGHDAGYEAVSLWGKASVNPTYQEMKDFLQRDTTNTKQYIAPTYVCHNFASDVCNNAEAAGIRAAVVVLDFEKEIHEIVAFETTDKGLVFIEPQFDREAKLVIGQHYWPSVGSPTPTDHDDTIKRFIVFW